MANARGSARPAPGSSARYRPSSRASVCSGWGKACTWRGACAAQPSSRAIERNSACASGVPASPLTITTTACCGPTALPLAASNAAKPAFSPVCWKPGSPARLSNTKPRPRPPGCGVSIWRAMSALAKRVGRPAIAFCSSAATRPRSLGVVHRPAAANSGWLLYLPGMACPRRWPLATLGTRAAGSGWKNPLASMPSGCSTAACIQTSNGWPARCAISACSTV